MLKNLKKVAAIVLSFAMAVQFGLADSYYVNAVEEPVEPQQEETTTTAPQEQEQVPTTEEETPQQQEEDAPATEETNEQSAPETKSVELSYVAEDGTVLHETASRDFNLDYSLKTDSSVMLNFDGYTLKDVIINNSQTVPADQANLSVTSDLVSVKFVYVSVNIKEDKQTSENNEQTKTEEASEDDAEADPETKEELPEYPAFDQSETAGNVVVHATAAEGVLPRDSKLVVKRITRKAILNAVEDTVSEKNKEMDSAVALDITIQNKDGVEIQPNGSVNISFENAAVSGDEINIYHVTDDASAVTEVATNTQSFDANHFSIYVITGVNDVPLTTFNFVVNDTTVSKPTTVSTQIVKSGDTLIAPTAPDVAGKAFVGWYDGETKFEDFNIALTITETKTREITAKYVDALYVYFYNPEGTQIMRTEKVGDHDPHSYSHVSYDVDSTHKLVGWAAEAEDTTNIADSIAVRKGRTSVNVYAIIEKGYWVTFDSNGGSAIDSQFVLNGDNLDLDKIPDPTKPGYTFDGWYNGSSKVENVATVTSSMTLKAHWNAAQVSYTINYWQQKVTDDKNATDAQKTYEYVEAETKKETTGAKISATNSKKYKGFTYNANNSSKDVEISGDGTTIINVYYDRVLCTVNFYAYESTGWFGGGSWNIIKTETGLYGANLPEGVWDSSSYWTVKKSGGTGCILLTSFDFETAGYADNQDNVTENGVITTCNFYRQGKSGSSLVHYYNEQADGTFKLVQTINTTGSTLNVHEKYVGYDLYKYTTAKNPGTSSSYWEKQKDVYDGKRLDDYPVSIASKLKTYSLSYYNYNGVAKTVENIKYTASLESYANYTPEKPSGLPEYYEFGGWYKDKACTTKFDFNTEKMPNANVQIYAKWTAQKINLTFNLNTPDGTSKVVNSDVDAGTIASTVLPSATTISDYSFAGWYYADGNGNITKDAFNANEAITKNTSVIGKWLYNGELTVVYDPGTEESKATVPTDSNIYAGGAKVTVAGNATTTSGKKFLGWKLKESLYYPGDAFEVNKNLANNDNIITLEAIWGDEEHSTTMSYNPGNGRGDVKTVPVKNNEVVTLKSEKDWGYQARKVEGKEYYFAGWATSMDDANNGKATYAAGQIVHVDVKGENVLYATWIEKTVITLVANSDTFTYNGKAQSVEGFKDVADGYTVSGLTAKATGTNVGEYTTVIEGTAKVKKGKEDVTEKVVVNVVPGKLTISRRNVTLTSASDEKVYDGNALTNGTVTADGFVEGQGATYDVTGTITNVGEKANAFTYTLNEGTNPDNYEIKKTEGTLKVIPITDQVTVTITGNAGSVTYDGNSHKVTGYTTSFSNALYTANDFEFSGKAEASRTNAGQTNMGLTSKQFTNTSANFANVEFVVTDGYSKVEKRTVTLTSASDEKVYDGNALTNGTVTADGFVEGQGATYDVTGSQKDVGESKNTFTYTLNEGTNPDNYEIKKAEGTLKVTPVTDKVTVTITGNTDSVKYDGNSHQVTGYTTSFSNALYTANDFEFSGTAEAEGKDADTYNMGLKKDQFKNTSKNFTNVEFVVKDGQLVIGKRDVTLTSGSASKVYDKNALTNDTVTVSGEGFAKNEGATYKVTGSRTKVGTSKNTFTYELKSNTKASNYNITKVEGDLVVTAQDGEVVVTITGHSDTVEYDGNEKSVSGYDVSITQGSTYEVSDFTFTGNDEVKGTEVNTYPMGLKVSDFTNNNDNYNKVKFVVTDGSLTITPKSIVPTDDNGITVEKPADTTYNGSEQRNKPTVTDTKTKGTLVEGIDYTLSYSEDVTNAGTVTVTITGIGNYNGTVDTSYEINPKGYTVTTDSAEKVYDGTKLTAGGHVDGLVEGETVSFKITGSRINEGTSDNTYELKFEGTAKAKNYTHGEDSIGKLKVTKKSIVPDGPDTPDEKKTGIKVTKPEDTMYNGEEQKNKPVVRDTKRDVKLVEDKDYTLSYTAAINVGTVTVTITGIGNYEGNVDTSYEITKRHVTLTSASDSKVYDKKALTNDTVTVSGDGFVKDEGATYDVTGSQTETGSSKNTFTYTLNEGTNADNYEITKAEGTLTVTPFTDKVTVTIKGHEDTATYDGNPHSVEGYEVTNISNTLYKVNDIGFTGEAKAEGTAAGTHQMNLKKDQFSNISQNFTNVEFVVEDGSLTINPKSITPDGPNTPEDEKTGITVTDPADSIYDGKAHVNPLTVRDTKTGKDLVENKDYTLTYSDDVTNVGTVKVTVKGKGNYTGEFTKKYQILPREYTVTTDSANKTYDGTVLTAGGHVNGLVEGETVSFKTTGSQINEGTSDNTYELKFEGTAVETNYKHGKDSIGKLKVTKKSIVPDGPDTPDEKKTGITVNEPSDSKYDGKEHREVLTVTDTKTGKELVAGTDYSITYSSDLVNAGTVTIKVAGLGNYTGSFEKTYKITKRSVTLTSATVSKVYDGSALTNTSITVSGDGFVEGEGASYEVTGTQTEVGNSANAFEYKLNEKTLASNYNITKVVGTLTITAAPAPVTPATPSTPSTPSSTTSTTPRTLSAPQVTTPVETVEKETTPKAEPKKEEKVEEEYTPKASPQYYWALINLICAILTVLFGLLLLISKRHKSEDDDEEDDETKQQTTNDDEEEEQEKKRGLFTRVLAVLIAIVSVVFFLVTEDLSLPWTWTDQWTIWMVVIGLVQIVVFFVGRKWKNVDNDDEDEEAQQA